MFNLISKSEKTIKDKPKKSQVLKPGKIKKLQFPGNVYSVATTMGYTIGSRGVFQSSEYDLGEVAKVMDIEAYVRQAFNKHVEQCLKEGYKIVSRNSEATDYIRKRLHEIGEASGRTFDSILRGIITNVVSFSNCFLVKKRDRLASSGLPRTGADGERIEPVAGYFILDPTSIQIKRNIHGTVKKYKQVLPGVGRYPLFSPVDIIHMAYDRKEGFAWGTPYIIPVLDDIRTLRRMEENVEMLTLAHLFPLFQYIVGTEDHPAEVYEDGTTEVDIIKEEIENMPTEGSIVTPERHKIEAIGSEGKALDAKKYLEHFEARVLAGLGISEIALGRGGTANRACYSEDTETLTDSGWKNYWQISPEDKIATFNQNKNSLEFHKPNGDILLYDYNGKMVSFKNRNVDVLVTPDHDMWVGYESDSGKGVRWTKEHADNIKTKRVKFLSSGLDWDGIHPEDFKLPFVSYKNNFSFENSLDFGRIKIEDWLEFLGYYVSEGTLAKAKHKWAISISQNSVINPEKTNLIRFCLKRLPFKFNEYTDKNDGTTRFWINCKSLYLYLQESCGDYSYKKQFPEEILSYDSNSLNIVFEAAMLGDGTTDTRDGRTSRSYYSNSEKLTDQMQEIAMKLQYRAHIVLGSRCYRLLMSKHNLSTVSVSQIENINYSGKVYCFNVPNHLFITRRNGKIGIHGNTAATIDKGLQDRCKDFQDVIEGHVTEYLFKELLLEGGFKIDETEENIVKLVFNEIDLDTQIKAENHAVFKYEHDVTTESETRELLGKDPISEEQRKDMYFEHVTKPKAIIMAVDEPYTAEAKQNGAIAKVSKEEKKKKETIEKNQPSNQHGRKMAKTTTKKDELLKEAVKDINKVAYADEYLAITDGLHGEIKEESAKTEVTYNPVLVMKLKSDIEHYWNMTKDDVIDYVKETYIDNNRNFRDFTPEKLKMILFLTKDSMVKKSEIYAFKALSDGIKKATRDVGREDASLSFDPNIKYKYLNERMEHYTTSLLSDLGTKLVKNINPDFSDGKEARGKVMPVVMGVFDALEYRLSFTAHTEIMKAYNFGYALAMRDLGYNELYIKLDSNHCKKCEEASVNPLSLEYFSFEDVAPVHPMCNCTYMIRKA